MQSKQLKANEGDAIKAFNDKNNDQFHVLDLYVFCINLADGKFTSQLDQSLVGTSAESLRYGQDQYGKRLLSTLREAPEGKVISVAYNALRPGTKSGAVPKVSFVARIGKQGCGVGYYRQKLQPSQSDELPPSREAIRSGLIIEALDKPRLGLRIKTWHRRYGENSRTVISLIGVGHMEGNRCRAKFQTKRG